MSVSIRKTLGAILIIIVVTLPSFVNDVIHKQVMGDSNKPFDVLFFVQDQHILPEWVYYTATSYVWIIQIFCVVYSIRQIAWKDDDEVRIVFTWLFSVSFCLNCFTYMPSPQSVQQEGYIVPLYFGVGEGSLIASPRFGWMFFCLHRIVTGNKVSWMARYTCIFSVIFSSLYVLLTHQLYCSTLATSVFCVFFLSYWCKSESYMLLVKDAKSFIKSIEMYGWKAGDKPGLKTRPLHGIDEEEDDAFNLMYPLPNPNSSQPEFNPLSTQEDAYEQKGSDIDERELTAALKEAGVEESRVAEIAHFPVGKYDHDTDSLNLIGVDNTLVDESGAIETKE